MTAAPAYAPRFTFARVLADCWRVVARSVLPLAGALVLSAALTTVASLPWWQAPAGTPSDLYERLWVVVTTAKNAIVFGAAITATLLITAISLRALTDASWGDVLRPRGLALALVTALCVGLPQYVPNLAEPLALAIWPSRAAPALLGLAGVVGYFASLATMGIAVPVALADRVGPAAAIARSFRLLRRLRWRTAAIGFAYLVIGALAVSGAEMGLSQAGMSYVQPGWGRAALGATTIAIGAVGYIAFVSLYMQARRIADGPSAVELEEVFA